MWETFLTALIFLCSEGGNMKRIITFIMIGIIAASLCACGKSGRVSDTESNSQTLNETIIANDETTGNEMASGTSEENTTQASKKEESEVKEIKIRITVGGTQLTATLENNATTRAIVAQMPMTLHMMDLYGREMCYRYGAYALPTDNMRDDNYAVGDIAYWAPGGSLVILYEQNGEEFSRQHLGHIDSGVEVFKTTGDADVTFELME